MTVEPVIAFGMELCKTYLKAFANHDYRSRIRENSGRKVQFYNFWSQPLDEMYWSRWFGARPYLFEKKPDLKVGMFSVFGDRRIIEHTKCDVNFFYSAENLKVDTYRSYADSCLGEPKIDLSMGFEYFEHERYCRFPNWMDVFFLQQEDVKTVCSKLRFPRTEGKDRFASCVASHDGRGLRTSMVEALGQIETVSCPGKYRHNDDTLLKDYGDDKQEYLKNFCFNICPENSNADGYVTEKLFQAISAGCIPVYWGSCNRPEPDILDKNAIIFWKRGGDNSDCVKLIADLMASPALMKEFLSQPRLLDTAEEYILDSMNEVEKKIKSAIGRVR